MIRVNVGETLVEIPGHLVIEAVEAQLAGQLGKMGGTARSAIKHTLPLLLGLFQVKTLGGVQIPPPDLRCPAAKKDIIAYFVDYILSNAATMADDFVFTVEGEEDGGTLHVTGLIATPAVVDTQTAGAERAVLAGSLGSTASRDALDRAQH